MQTGIFCSVVEAGWPSALRFGNGLGTAVLFFFDLDHDTKAVG
jgi:hypothetical protein